MRQSVSGDKVLSNISIRLMHDSMLAARVDPWQALGPAGVDRDVVENPSGTVAIRTEKAVQSTFAAINCGTREIFADVGARFNPAMFGIAGLALMTVPTVRRWIGFMMTTDFHYSIADYALVDLDATTSALQLTLPPDTSAAMRRLTLERDVASLLTYLSDVWRGSFPMTRLELALHAVPPQLRTLAQCPVTAGHLTTRLVWDSEVNDYPLPRANEHAFVRYAAKAHAEHAVATGTTTDSAVIVRAVTELLKEPGNAGLPLAEVARRLWMTPRTLQRKLADQNVGFRTLREDAMSHEARRLLVETDLPIAEIATRLDYGDISAISAAFRRWIGQTPSEFRRTERRRLVRFD